MAKLLYQKQKSLSTLVSVEKDSPFKDLKVKGCPKIEKILKELTPKRIKKEIEKIQKIKLPTELQKWVREYEKVGDRDKFIWKWTYLGWKILTLPTVAKKYRNPVYISKTSSIILNVLVDDLADKKKNKKMLEEAWNICFKYKNNNKWMQCTRFKFSKKEQEYLELIRKIWNFLNNSIKKYPRYKELKDFFLYDYHQFFNSMKYSYFINKNFNFINLTECEVYSPHNMQGIIGTDIDLMCSPSFNVEEIGLFREVIWQAQQMGKIGNSITTWEREISEEDFSSNIFAFALKHRFISIKEFRKENKTMIVNKIKKSNIESFFLKQWEEKYNEIRKLGKQLKSIDIKKFLFGLENLMIMHLISRRLK